MRQRQSHDKVTTTGYGQAMCKQHRLGKVKIRIKKTQTLNTRETVRG